VCLAADRKTKDEIEGSFTPFRHSVQDDDSKGKIGISIPELF
jgi:hypothetical protein